MSDTINISRVELRESHIQFNHKRMVQSQRARIDEWKRRHETLEGDTSYQLPRIHSIYARVLIREEQRDALHVTRKVIEAVTKHSFLGSQGWVAQFSQVTGTMSAIIFDELKHDPQTPGERSLFDCMELLRQCSYNISEGPTFVRTPLVLPRLEEKYYVEDLHKY